MAVARLGGRGTLLGDRLRSLAPHLEGVPTCTPSDSRGKNQLSEVKTRSASLKQVLLTNFVLPSVRWLCMVDPHGLPC